MKMRLALVLVSSTLPFWFGCQSTPTLSSHGLVSSTPVPAEEPSSSPDGDMKNLGIRIEVDRAEPPAKLSILADVTRQLSRYRRVAYVDLKNWKVTRILVSERARRWRSDLYLSEDCLKQGWTACRLSLEPDGLDQLKQSYRDLGISVELYGYAYDAFPLLDFLEANRDLVVKDLKQRGFDRLIVGNQTRVKSTTHRVQLNGWRHWEQVSEVQAYWNEMWRSYAQFRVFHDFVMQHMSPMLRIVDVDLDHVSPAMIEKWTMMVRGELEFYRDVIRDYSVQRIQLADQTVQWDDRLTLDASMHAQVLSPEVLAQALSKVPDRTKPLFFVGKIPVMVGEDERSVPSLKIEKAKRLLTSKSYVADSLAAMQIDRIQISRTPERLRLASGLEHKTSLVLDPPDLTGSTEWLEKNLQLATEQRDRNFRMEARSLNRMLQPHVQFVYEDHARVNPDQMRALMNVLSHNSQWVADSKIPYTVHMSDHMDRQRHNLFVDVTSTWFTSEDAMTKEIQRLFLNNRTPSTLSQSEAIQGYQNIHELQDLADVDDDGSLSD